MSRSADYSAQSQIRDRAQYWKSHLVTTEFFIQFGDRYTSFHFNTTWFIVNTYDTVEVSERDEIVTCEW